MLRSYAMKGVALIGIAILPGAVAQSQCCGDYGSCCSEPACGACDLSQCGSCCCKRPDTYISLFGGFNGLEDQNSTGFMRDLNTDFDGGFGLGFALGKYLEGPLRAEAEFTYRNNEADTIVFNGVNQPNVAGDINNYSVIMNLFADWGDRDSWFRPYVGGGVGFSFVNSSYQYAGLPAMLNGEDSGFAYQGIAGVTMDMTDTMEFFVEYRFFGVLEPKLNRIGGPPINGAPQNLILDSEYDTHAIMAGVRMLRW